MPRKPPTNVIEHRISLSDFERKQLKELINAQEVRGYVGSAAALMQGVSWPLLAAAALWWVGFSLDEFVDDVKDFIDSTSTKVKTWMESKGYVNYQADEIGREIEKVGIEKEETYAAMIAFYNEHPDNYNSKKGKAYRAKLTTLEKRDQILREILNDIATGKIAGYDIELHGDIQSGYFKDQYGRVGTIYEYNMQQLYESYGGEGVLDWEMDTDEDQAFTEGDTRN